MEENSKKTLTSDNTQLEVVVLSVFLLDGHKKSVDTEDIAIKCHKLSPGMFSWRKYPDQINLEIVRVVLSNAKKLQYGKLLSGSGRDGWRLSQKGVEWVQHRGKQILNKGIQWTTDRQAGSIDTRRKQREKNRLLQTSAWSSWTKTKYISLADARNLFRIDDYSTENMSQMKIVRLQSLFNDDPEIFDFLSKASKAVLNKEE